MAKRLQDYEDETKRTVAKTRTEIHEFRYYDPPFDHKTFASSGLCPSEGDALPGETDSGLGPFIARNGINWRKQPGGARPLLELHGITLRLETES